MSPRTAVPEVRRESILKAARLALVEKGYHDMRLDDVARGAGIAKGTLYLYFKDKEDIIAAVYADLLDRLEERLRQAAAAGGSLKSLQAIVGELLDFVDAHHDFLAQLGGQKSLLCGPKASRALRDRYLEHLRFIEDRLSRGVREGALRPHDATLGAVLLTSLVRTFKIQKSIREEKAPLRERAPQVMEIFLKGFGRP